MPAARPYESFEVRKMLQDAEGRPSPTTGQGAHSRGLHALVFNKPNVPAMAGASKADMLDRTHKRTGESNSQFKNRDGKPKTSGFKSLLDQADAAYQALNSSTGQTALAVFDDHSRLGHRIRVVLDVAAIRQFGFLNSFPQTATPMVVATKNSPTVDKPLGGAAGVKLILDGIGGSNVVHIQTCYPLDSLSGSSYSVQDMGL